MEKQSEHGAQTALFRTVAMHETQRPELALLFAIPNGGKRDKITAAKLKAEGVKAGVPDLMLPVARGGYHGLFIELKVGDNRPSQLQRDWIARLQGQGYYCAVCWDWTQAVEMFLSYLDGVYTL
jgi:hypothetical protein